jgi:hypothetical protein
MFSGISPSVQNNKHPPPEAYGGGIIIGD